jgi:guanine deaminase
MSAEQQKWMAEAIRLSLENVRNTPNGPFGAVIVRGDELIAAGSNSVAQTIDPTAHAEVMAIRAACRKLGTFELRGCEIYSSCEPCPMCLGAIYWAHLDRVYYANTRFDAARFGFDDEFIYSQFASTGEQRTIPIRQVHVEGADEAFRVWMGNPNKIQY